MWLDIRIWLCDWTKSLLVSFVGVCVTLSYDGSNLVVLGLPVLKRQSLGLGDPKLSLLRLWGQSSCFFYYLTPAVSSERRVVDGYVRVGPNRWLRRSDVSGT